ncbi:MAG: hypothetical protein Q8Q37_01560 [bacterium]|nr:hypothetical protein [bacterium]
MNYGINKITASIIISSLIIVAAALYLGWQYVFPPSMNKINGITTGRLPDDTPPAANIATTNNETNQSAISIPAQAISKNQTTHYWINRTSDEILYFDLDGFLHQLSADSQDIKLNLSAVKNLHDVKPSNDGTKAIISFGYPAQTSFVVFDADTETYKSLPSNVNDSAWDPISGNRLTFARKDLNDTVVGLLNVSDQKITNIIRLSQPDLKIDWPLPQEIYLSSKPSAMHRESLWSVNINTGAINNIINDVPGLMVKWSPNGQKGLIFTGNGINNFFGLINNKAEVLIDWVSITLPNKCTLGNDKGYCAIPRDIKPGTILPDDYLKRSASFNDNIYELDFNTAKITSVLDSIDIDADQLSFDKNSLFFINRLDNLLYKLNL